MRIATFSTFMALMLGLAACDQMGGTQPSAAPMDGGTPSVDTSPTPSGTEGEQEGGGTQQGSSTL